MPAERHTLQNPERVKAYVEGRCTQLGFERADVIAATKPGWKSPLGEWTYDHIVKLKGGPILRDKLRKLSMVLGWESDGIEAIDAGGEPRLLRTEEGKIFSAEIAEVRDRVEHLIRMEEGRRSNGLQRGPEDN